MKSRCNPQMVLWVLLGLTLVANGCAQPLSANTPTPTPIPKAKNSRGVLIREAMAEAALFRSELAAMKIAQAKQTAELESARSKIGHLRNREKELGLKVRQTQENLVQVQAEREQLQRRNVELQAQSTALPELHQLVAQIKTIHAAMGQMMNPMKSMMADVTQIKQDMLQNQRKLQKQTAKLTALNVSPHQKPQASSANLQSITVKWGDTLWEISRTYGISVEELKKINGMKSNLIVVGQRLQVPLPLDFEGHTPRSLDYQSQRNSTQSEESPEVIAKNNRLTNSNEEP